MNNLLNIHYDHPYFKRKIQAATGTCRNRHGLIVFNLRNAIISGQHEVSGTHSITNKNVIIATDDTCYQ